MVWGPEGASLLGIKSPAPVLPIGLHFPLHSYQQTQPPAISPLGKTAFTTLGEKPASYIGWVGVNISKDTRQQLGIFPPQLPRLTRRHHFLGDMYKNVFFTLPEKVGARAFSACCAGAHVTNMPWCDSKSPRPLALSESPGDSV